MSELMRRTVLGASLVALAAACFLGGYVYRSHVQSVAGIAGGPTPTASASIPPIDPSAEAVATRIYCGHVAALPVAVDAYRLGRVWSASRRLGLLSNALIKDSRRFGRANDFELENSIPGPASFLTHPESLADLFGIVDGLRRLCAEARQHTRQGQSNPGSS